MKAKEFLKRYRDTEREINAKLEEISRLRALATKVTQTLTRGKKSPRQHEDRTAAIIAKIVDMEREVDAEIDRLQDIKREVQTVITAVPDAKLRELLVRRYICGQKWEKIAAEMHYSYYYVKNRLHFKAIKKMSTQRSVHLGIEEKTKVNSFKRGKSKRPVTFKLNGLMWLVSLLFCIISH